MKSRSFRILGAAMAALLPACGGGGGGSGGGSGNRAFPVTVQKPSGGQTFTAPATISLSAVAADPGTIAKVEFFWGQAEFASLPPPANFNPAPSSLIATLTQPPFQFTWTQVQEGILTLVARATDTLGTQTFSNTVTISVLPPGESPGGWVPIARVPPGMGLWFVDGDRGWVVGNHGTILHTVDGGATWVQQTQVEGIVANIQFVDADRGWAVGEFVDDTVLRTTDGGATWIPNSTGMNLQALSFVDSDTGWVVGLGDNVFATNDGGVTWTPLPTGVSGNELNLDVHFVDRLNGWVLGLVQMSFTDFRTVILHTTDGGLTWTEQLRTAPDETFLAMDFVSATTGWVSRTGGPLLNSGTLFTSDGGATWTERPFSEFVGIFALDFVSPTQGWGVGSVAGRSGGRIIHTADGGVTWTTQQGPGQSGDPRYLDVRFVNADRGWALRSDGILLKTTTGGKGP